MKDKNAFVKKLQKMNEEEMNLEMNILEKRHLNLAKMTFECDDENEIEFLNEQMIECSLKIALINAKLLIEEC
jgi:hypothetical protein